MVGVRRGINTTTNPPEVEKICLFQNIWGEEFEGYVTDVMKSKPNIIWAKVQGELMMIDMNNIKRWKYKEILPTQTVSYVQGQGYKVEGYIGDEG